MNRHDSDTDTISTATTAASDPMIAGLRLVPPPSTKAGDVDVGPKRLHDAVVDTTYALARPMWAGEGWLRVTCTDLLRRSAIASHGLAWIATTLPARAREQIEQMLGITDPLEHLSAELAAWRTEVIRMRNRGTDETIAREDGYVLDAWLDLRRESLEVLALVASWVDLGPEVIAHLADELTRERIGREIAAAHARTALGRLLVMRRTVRGRERAELFLTVLEEAERARPGRHLRHTNRNLIAITRARVDAMLAGLDAGAPLDLLALEHLDRGVYTTLRIVAEDETRRVLRRERACERTA